MIIKFVDHTNKYTIHLHDVNLFSKYRNMFTYLFSKKYLLKIDYNLFKRFIKECMLINVTLIHDDIIENQRDLFEINIIQLIEHYPLSDSQTKCIITVMIGNIILNNIEYFDFFYLRKLQNFFDPYGNSIEGMQCRFLIILLNNLVKVKVKPILQKPNTILEENILDFIYDYNLS
jgi:hypothetical protein